MGFVRLLFHFKHKWKKVDGDLCVAAGRVKNVCVICGSYQLDSGVEIKLTALS